MEGMMQKVRMTMMSHLSDVQESFGSDQIRNMNRLNFVKYLLQKYADTSVQHDPDRDWEEFEKTRFYYK